jgi:hypothetical protein
LPLMGSWQRCFKGDSLRFGFNELKGVRGSHRSEEIGWWFVLNGNQNLDG